MKNEERVSDSSFIIHHSSFCPCPCRFPVHQVTGNVTICVNCRHTEPVSPAVSAAMALRPAWQSWRVRRGK